MESADLVWDESGIREDGSHRTSTRGRQRFHLRSTLGRQLFIGPARHPEGAAAEPSRARTGSVCREHRGSLRATRTNPTEVATMNESIETIFHQIGVHTFHQRL